MDHVVHINNGSEPAKPIVLHLLPGEETIFNLKVVNHGDPSNVSLEASDPVFKAVRLKKPDHYVVMEENIPIFARMPSNKKRLDGEIVLTGNKGESRIPIYLLRDSEDPGIDLDDPGIESDKDLKDDPVDDDFDDDEAEEVRLDRESYGDGENALDEDDSDEEDPSPVRKADEEREVRRIAFSRDRDLQRYKTANRPRNIEESRVEYRDRYVEEPAYVHTEVAATIPAEEQKEQTIDSHPTKSQRPGPDYQSDYQAYSAGQSYTGKEYSTSSETDTGQLNEEDEYQNQDQDHQEGSIGNLLGTNALKIIPVIIFLALVVVLVLTFVTQTLPEFPGALASSILIVTLIIYGAATLLKA